MWGKNVILLAGLAVCLFACSYELPKDDVDSPSASQAYYGEGSDGQLLIYPENGGTVINKICTQLNNEYQGGENYLAVASTAGFKDNDEIFIHTAQGSGAGNYEFQRVKSVQTGVLILEKNLMHAYVASGLTFVYRVPHYTTVIVPEGAKISADTWSPSMGGGVVVFRAQNSVFAFGGGSINVSGKGFQGHIRQADNANGYQGEGYLGAATQSQVANGNGGGGGEHAYGGGGGGGHAVPGMQGISGDAIALGGEGGDAVGNEELSLLFLGGAGGAGGDNDLNGAADPGGGCGGGIIYIAAPLLDLQNVTANGSHGNPSTGQDGGSGGGAGGSIYLIGHTVKIQGTLTALGGAGFTPPNTQGGKGGDGAYGRIRIAGQLTNNGVIYPSPYTK